MIDEKNLLLKLDDKNIFYNIHKHDALFTVEDSLKNRGKIDGAHSKNLFLKNKKNKYFLITCLENSKIELKKLSKSLSLGNISFAKSGALLKLLGVMPGSVTPFGLLNDVNNKVEFYLDSGFLEYKKVNFHPLVNTSTITLDLVDFKKFFIENKKKINILDLTNYSIIDKKN